MVLFLDCLALTLFASALLTKGLDELGEILRIPAGLFGLMTALGANAPEISSSVAALLSGARDVGLGVVLGSNMFNLAALLGLSAMVAGPVRAHRAGLVLHGGVGLWVTLAGGALVVGWLSPVLSVVLMAAVVLPYGVALATPPHRLRRLPLPDWLTGWLARSVTEVRHEESTAEKAEREDAKSRSGSAWGPIRVIGLALLAIVGGSIGMVNTALVLGHDWGVPQRFIGTLALAALTGLPNAYAAVRLARKGQGAAVVSEAFNSNTLNILIGIGLPALIFGLGKAGARIDLEVAWLLGMTVVAGLLCARKGSLTRVEGGIVIALYLIFVGVYIAR
ncbi:MAG: hypothetical protein M3Y28_04130 [Armatimonadota bacterium]|nr:hypothetical protein [Armatimonadota bacterium]